MNSESTLSDALSEVDTALAASDNERAAGLASELLLAYPNAVAVLRQRARALAAAGRSLQAAEVHRRVLEILPADGEAMAGLARTLHSAGQQTEARDAARQALDYWPSDEMLKRIAAGEGQPFQPDDASVSFFKAQIHTQVGLFTRGIAGLRAVLAKWPERTDVRIALMQALWRKGARIAAAEEAQGVLDDYPSCLNAHLLMLDVWRTAGASEMERVHLQAIEQVDPDHRATHVMLGTQSPLPIKDVPARPAQPSEPATNNEEDPLAREAWVDSLMAESSALPKPLEQPQPADEEVAGATVDETAPDAAAESGEQAEFISSLLPLEWSAASDLSDESAQDDFGVSWIDGNVKDAFLPARPRTAEPDPRDGVPAELSPLEWEGEEENKSLKPLAAAGIVAAAVKRTEDAPQETSDAGVEAQNAAPQATIETTSQLDAESALPESAPAQNISEAKVAQATEAEVESAAVKPLPIDAVEFVDEDVHRWDAEAVQPAPLQEMPVLQEETPAVDAASQAPENPIAPTTTVNVNVTTNSEPAPIPAATAPADDESGAPLMKAMAAATAASVVSKKRKKKSEAEVVAADVQPAQIPSAETQATQPAAQEAPATTKAKSTKTPKAPKTVKPSKKTPVKPNNYEAQTEKVRKTYERAIATAKRDDLPRLIGELNQAAQRDPDNKIIFELLGQAYNRSGDIPAAISAYRKALDLAEQA